ncbi:ABC transporter ATP-binding protein [Oscillospiraceae bacterium 42-9]
MLKRFKQFVSFYKPYAGWFFADMACALLMSAIALVVPLGVRTITEDVLAQGMASPQGRILRLGLILFLLVIVQALCQYFLDYQGHHMGAKMERDMRAQLFRHCQGMSFSFYDTHKVGELMSRITADSLSLAEFFHHFPEDVVVNAIQLLGATVILFQINWKVTLALLALLPFMAAYTLYYSKKMREALAEGRRSAGDVNAQVEDSLSGVRVVQSFTNEELEAEKFDRQNQRFLESRRRGYQGEAKLYCGMDAFANLLPIAVAVFGGLAIWAGAMKLPDLVLFMLYVNYFSAPVRSLANTSRLLQEGATSFARYWELMDMSPEIQDSPEAQDFPKVKGCLELRDISFSYDGGASVLHGLTLTVEAGEYVALVGASGVGKTTLCSLIPRFYQVQKGQILLDGLPVEKAALRSLRQNIGMVQQDVYLFAGTIGENIAYGKPGCTQEEIVAAAQKAGAHEFIQKLPQGYDTDVGPHGVRLSGGQQQRVSIARVFLKDPPILIFDEATSALDAHSERVVQESLERLAQRRTTLVIAHRLSTVRKAGRILVLDENGVCEQGTHQELLALGGVYAGLYQAADQL